jgi:hypothetical protein
VLSQTFKEQDEYHKARKACNLQQLLTVESHHCVEIWFHASKLRDWYDMCCVRLVYPDSCNATNNLNYTVTSGSEWSNVTICNSTGSSNGTLGLRSPAEEYWT